MRIFLAGATGVVGTRLVPLLVGAGHQVTGTTTTAPKGRWLRAAGAEPVVLDLLDERAVHEAASRAAPDVVVHQATALASMRDPRRFDEEFAATNRLRTEGTDHLLAAARAAGARRFVAQSFAGWRATREGGAVETEDEPLDLNPVEPFRRTIAAIHHQEQAVTGAEGIEGLVLRYGGFYGPGTSLGPHGAFFEAVRQRKLPVVGGGTGVWSFVHADDVATATFAAIEHGAAGIYNVVDDEPAPVSEWLPALAEAIGAPPPRRVPAWLGRLLAGEAIVVMMTDVRGASNEKIKRELGWRPAYASWRDGFTTLVPPAVAADAA